MQDFTIVFLGTSSGTRERNVASVAMVLDGTVLLFDCGEGTQHQLLRAPVRSGSIEAIFISHRIARHDVDEQPRAATDARWPRGPSRAR